MTEAALIKAGILNKEGKVNNLGSTCPIIIKHDFPDESKNYIDATGGELTSTQKRFRYDRPQTAKTGTSHASAFGKEKSQPRLEGVRPSTSNGGHSVPIGITNMNSSQLFSKLIATNKNDKREGSASAIIKPQIKLNIAPIHNALYEIKMQQQILDEKIKQIDDTKRIFSEKDFYNFAKQSAIEAIFIKSNDEMNVPSESNRRPMTAQSLKPPVPRFRKPTAEEEIFEKPDYLKLNQFGANKTLYAPQQISQVQTINYYQNVTRNTFGDTSQSGTFKNQLDSLKILGSNNYSSKSFKRPMTAIPKKRNEDNSQAAMMEEQIEAITGSMNNINALLENEGINENDLQDYFSESTDNRQNLKLPLMSPFDEINPANIDQITMMQLKNYQFEMLQNSNLPPDLQEEQRQEFQNQFEMIRKVYNIPLDAQMTSPDGSNEKLRTTNNNNNTLVFHGGLRQQLDAATTSNFNSLGSEQFRENNLKQNGSGTKLIVNTLSPAFSENLWGSTQVSSNPNQISLDRIGGFGSHQFSHEIMNYGTLDPQSSNIGGSPSIYNSIKIYNRPLTSKKPLKAKLFFGIEDTQQQKTVQTDHLFLLKSKQQQENQNYNQQKFKAMEKNENLERLNIQGQNISMGVSGYDYNKYNEPSRDLEITEDYFQLKNESIQQFARPTTANPAKITNNFNQNLINKNFSQGSLLKQKELILQSNPNYFISPKVRPQTAKQSPNFISQDNLL